MTEPDDDGRHRLDEDPPAAEVTSPAPTWVPERKVASGAFGGALAIVILWGIGLSGVDVPPEVASAITALVVAGIAYLVPGAV